MRIAALCLAFLFSACSTPSDRSADEGERVAIVSGNQQGAPLGTQLAQPLTAGVFNGAAPVKHARLAWAITYGDGQLSADTTAVSDSGTSHVSFTVGKTAGTDSVRATLVGTNDAVTFGTVAGESQTPWPNEPAAFHTLTDWGFDLLTAEAPWKQSRGMGWATIVPDSTAPLSPPNVLQFTYPTGLPSGSAPATLYFNPSPGGREFYTAFWWKANANWQGDPSGINKILFWQDDASASGNLIVMMNNQQQRDYFLAVTLEFNQATNGHLANAAGSGTVWHVFGNVHGNYVIVPGSWYRIELFFQGSTTPTSRDGVLRWFATKLGDPEGRSTEIGNYTNVNFDSPNFIQFSFSPTWGGNSGVTKLHTDYFRIDHVHVSAPQPGP
jgi:hypothetical protein